MKGLTYRVSDRPEMTRLVDMLDAWKKRNTWIYIYIYKFYVIQSLVCVCFFLICLSLTIFIFSHCNMDSKNVFQSSYQIRAHLMCHHSSSTPQGWCLLSQIPPFRYFPKFSALSNTRYLLSITSIFHRCHRSSTAVAHVKYEYDSSNLRGTFMRSKILLMEKSTNGALVTPTPSRLSQDMDSCYISILGTIHA